MLFASWYNLYNLKNTKSTKRGLLLLVKLQALDATLLKVRLLHGCFSRFLNCANRTKSHKASHIIHAFRIRVLLKRATLIKLLRNWRKYYVSDIIDILEFLKQEKFLWKKNSNQENKNVRGLDGIRKENFIGSLITWFCVWKSE